MIKFAFIGGTVRGFNLIKVLIKNNYFPKYSVILQEDDHESEKSSSEIILLLKKHKLDYSVKKKLLEEDYKKIKTEKLDFAIVYGWRSIIDPVLNEHLKFGLVAAHHSLLPEYRGFAPVQWAIINGEKETGATLFKINKGEIDSGEIIDQSRVTILAEDNGYSLDKKIVKKVTNMFLKFFQDFENSNIKLTAQDESKATYTCKRIPEDGRVNWNQNSIKVINLIRAISYPYPGAFCFYNETKYNIVKASFGKSNNKKFSGNIPGRVFRIYDDGIEVLCGEGTILLEKWENINSGKVECPSETVKSLNATLL